MSMVNLLVQMMIHAKKWVLQTIGSAWRRYKCALKRIHFQQYDNDKMRMLKRPKRVPKTMFKDLLKIWNDPKYEERCKKNKANRQVGKEKNFMHTSGPRSFARVRFKWKNNTRSKSSSNAHSNSKGKLTKRKPGDLRDKLINELQELDSEKDVDTVILNIIGSNNKKCRLNLHGRGVSSTQLKQRDIMKKVEEKHAKEVEAIQKDYEDKRQQDRMDIANGLRSFFSQFQQQNPHMYFDLSMFGSLLLDGHSEKDTNPLGLLQLHSSNSTSK
ncbi:Ketol-acid reductoisomerase mitochondrial, partial [Bienertia sinuspersici]